MTKCIPFENSYGL